MLKSNFEYQHLFHSFPKEKNKVDAVLNFDLLYKDCLNSQNNSADVFYYSPYLL